jgi:hypothetical protein
MGEREGEGKKPNKLPVEIGEAAREYAAEALAILINLARNGSTEVTRAAASKALRDRGYGSA